MVHNLPPHCSWSRPYTLQQHLTSHLLKAFPLTVLDTVLKRKPIFDAFLQISVLVPDTLGGFDMLAAAMTTHVLATGGGTVVIPQYNVEIVRQLQP